MKHPTGAVSTPASAPTQNKKAIQPSFPSLSNLPTTPEELFRSLALTVTTSVSQGHPTNKSTKKQDYTLPWVGFEGWRDARARLTHFEKHFKGKIGWNPFNDSTANDGPMSLNSIPGRAFIERVPRTKATRTSKPKRSLTRARCLTLQPQRLLRGLVSAPMLFLSV